MYQQMTVNKSEIAEKLSELTMTNLRKGMLTQTQFLVFGDEVIILYAEMPIPQQQKSNLLMPGGRG